MMTQWVERSAANLRAEVARAGRKKSELARVLGLSPAAVTRRLQGETPMDINELCTAAEWLNLPVSALIGGPYHRATDGYRSHNSPGRVPVAA